MSGPVRVASSPERKWAGLEAAERYRERRFGSCAAAARDPGIVTALLRQRALGPNARLLDVPCGSGRLIAALRAHGAPLCVDANLPMLELARSGAPGIPCVQASVLALPFADASFDAVVCCRLLHHLRDPALHERAVRELVRVSRGIVVASFWDSGSLPALRARLGLKRDEGPAGRGAVARRSIADLFEQAGARVAGFRAVLRFVSQQTFLVAVSQPGR